MEQNRPEISVIAPLYNEEGNINTLYKRLKSVLVSLGKSHEIIFVNDGSKDKSLSLVREIAFEDPAVSFIDFSRNFGHQVAVSAGLDFCRGNYAVIIDADLQDPPELIHDLFSKAKEGFEVVYARRKKREGESFLKKFTAKMFYRILSSITSFPIPVDVGDFRIIDRKVIDVLKQMPERQKYLRGQIAWAGFRQTWVEYERAGRMAGTTGYSYKKMIRFAMDGITSFSDLPLRLATLSGFVCSGAAFILIIYTLYSRLVLNDFEKGWASEMLSILFIGGIQLIAIGIIGEYISRMNTNLRARPLYVVSENTVPAPGSGKNEEVLERTE